MAGLVFCCRLIALDHAWKLSGGDEEAFETHFPITRAYLLEDRPYFTGELLSLIAYSLSRAPDKVPVIFWSPKKEYFFFKGDKFCISQFKSLIQRLLNESKELVDRLTFKDKARSASLTHIFDLEFSRRILPILRDNQSEHMANYSFLSDSRNTGPLKGVDSYLLTILRNTSLKDQAIRNKGSTGKYFWDIEFARNFINESEELLRKLLLLIHMTSGQPGRGPEITDLAIWNTTQRRRNIYIVDGRIMVTTW